MKPQSVEKSTLSVRPFQSANFRKVDSSLEADRIASLKAYRRRLQKSENQLIGNGGHIDAQLRQRIDEITLQLGVLESQQEISP